MATINNGAAPAAVEQRFRRNATVNQTVSVFAMEAPPQCAELLRALITQIRIGKTADGPLDKIKTLHFLSMTVFLDQRFDPTFVLEANFDGPAGPFWADLEAAIGPQLREILCFGKRPNGLAGDKFDVVTARGSQAPIAPLLEASAVSPTAVHQGDRWKSRGQIEQETTLFGAVQGALRNPQLPRQSANAIHQALRTALVPDHPILTMPPRPTPRTPDQGNLFRFVAYTILALNVIGVLLAWIISPFWAAAVFLLAIAAFVVMLWTDVMNLTAELKAGNGVSIGFGAVGIGLAFLVITNLIVAAVVVILSLDIVAMAPTRTAVETNAPILGAWSDQFKLIRAAWLAPELGHRVLHALWTDFVSGLEFAVVGMFGAFASALFVIVRLRALEQKDSSEHVPATDSQKVREMAALEDRGEQNHMSGLVHIRPGFVRSILMRVGLNFLGLAIRANPQSAVDGYLVTVRTIHFAHLTLVSNGARLLFLANFDGTWNNYLVDFIEKVHAWLTLVWTNGLGFPPTRFLVFDGATHGRLFTNWQRQSMAPTLYWFRAYPNLSVEQIRRQGQIADGLRKASLNPKEARTWAMCL